MQGMETHSANHQRKIRRMRQGTTAPTEMYLPDLDNTPLSQALEKGLDWGVEDEVMVECPKLKQYFGVDTLLIQRTSGRVHRHTKDEDETFPIGCLKTKFPIPLLKKALEGAEQQRATPKDLPGEDWPRKIKTILHRMELDCRLDAYAALVSRYARNSVSLEHAHMVSRGSTDRYYKVAKYEIRGRKISNRMDEILTILMQDNAYVTVEQAEVVLHSSFLWSLHRLVQWRGFRTAQGTVLNHA